MKNDATKFIEKYLDNELFGETLVRFENELKNNTELRAELKLQREVNNAIRDLDVIDLRKRLENIHQGFVEKSKKPKTRFLYNKYMLTAASVAIILVISLFAFKALKTEDSNNEKLFAKNYTPYEMVMNSRHSTDINDISSKAIQEYLEGNYSAAIPIFLELIKLDTLNMAMNFYLGISYMEMNSLHLAESTFTTIIDHNNNLFIEQSKWYLGLCYLKMDNIVKAKKSFSEISKEKNNYYMSKAEEILKNIE